MKISLKIKSSIIASVLIAFFQPSLVTASELDGLQVVSGGTCFFVDSFGTAVTNNHVIANTENVRVIASDGSSSPAKILKISEKLDVALLTTGLQTPNYLSLAPIGSTSLGQEVFTIGYPTTDILGDKPKYSEGTISALSGLHNDDSWIQMSTPIQPGNSGGPLVNFDGSVVGIVTATAAIKNFYSETGSMPQNINWAVKADYAKAIIPNMTNTVQLNNRSDVISHTEKSICRVVGYNGDNRQVGSQGREQFDGLTGTWFSLVSSTRHNLRDEGDYVYGTQVFNGETATLELKKQSNGTYKGLYRWTWADTWNQWGKATPFSCSMEKEIEFLKVSSRRIEGRAMNFKTFSFSGSRGKKLWKSCGASEAKNMYWEDFIWIRED